MKTIRQIADEINISKQRVYRYIKANRISEAHQMRSVMYYDDVAETAIKQAFNKSDCINETHQKHINETALDTVIDLLKSNNETLKSELDIKNRQIDELNTRLAEAHTIINGAQLLHGGTMQHQLISSTEGEAPTDERESEKQRRGIFGIFGKKKGNKAN